MTLNVQAETLLGLRWDNVHLAATPPVWTVPGSFRKGGQVHTVCHLNYKVTWWGAVRDRAIGPAHADGVNMPGGAP